MEIWLKQGEEEIQLPVLPAGFEVSVAAQNTSVMVSNFGEVNLIGKKALETITLEAFFPNKKYSFAQYSNIRKPNEYIKKLQAWMSEPIRLTITGTKINKLVTIETFAYREQDASGDVYYTLELKEYKKPKLKKKKKESNPKKKTKVEVAETKRDSKKIKSTTYTVKKGDTLIAISKRLTGTTGNYLVIAKQNKIANPNKIYPGQKLVITI